MIKIFVFLATSLAWQGCDLDLLKACTEAQDDTVDVSQRRYSPLRNSPGVNIPDRVTDPGQIRPNLACMNARLREHLDDDQQARKQELSFGFQNVRPSMTFSPLESPATTNESGSGRVTPVKNRRRTASESIPIKKAKPQFEQHDVDISEFMFERFYKEYRASLQQSAEGRESRTASDEILIIDNSGVLDHSEGEYMTDDDGSSIESEEDHLQEIFQIVDIPS